MQASLAHLHVTCCCGDGDCGGACCPAHHQPSLSDAPQQHMARATNAQRSMLRCNSPGHAHVPAVSTPEFISSSPHGVVTHEAGNEGARLLHIEQLAGRGRVGGQQAAQAQHCRGSVGCPAAGRRPAVLHGGWEEIRVGRVLLLHMRGCGRREAAQAHENRVALRASQPAPLQPRPPAAAALRRQTAAAPAAACCCCCCCCRSAADGQAAGARRHASPPAPAVPALLPGPAAGSWALVAARTSLGCIAAPPGPALR